MKLYRTATGPVVEVDDKWFALAGLDWDGILSADAPAATISRALQTASPIDPLPSSEILAPISQQEVWAAGVTYFRSRDARIEEAKEAGGGGGDFYARVYTAERPELFFKSTAARVAGPGTKVRIRRDAIWNIPEPELTLVINAAGAIVGYTIGNDMSSRDIEGENPLYLPQAKVYDRSAALGPCILLSTDPIPTTTTIRLEIHRGGDLAVTGETTLAQLKRKPEELAAYLYRELSFPFGCFLMTGTGVVPPSEFTLRSGDEIRISIDGIGTLVNTVE